MITDCNPSGNAVSAAALIAHCREHLARYKCPSRVVFMELTKASTGKIQNFKLREAVKAVI